MPAKKQVADKDILRQINQRLLKASLGAHSHVVVQVHKGDVTLSGTLEYQNQRKAVLRASRSVDGIRRVVDVMTVKPATTKWRQQTLDDLEKALGTPEEPTPENKP
jgi:osmotically-inducible protein OsmY